MATSAVVVGSTPKWFKLAPTIGLFILVTGLVQFVSTPSVVESPVVEPLRESVLGLKVTSRPHQLEAFWNPAAPPIAGSEKAALKVSDGDVTEVVSLDADDLHTGFVVYTPKTKKVDVRLEVSQNGSVTAESARVVAIP